MKIFRIYLFMCGLFIAAFAGYFHKCYDEFSLCLTTDTDEYAGGEFGLPADQHCRNHGSSLAIITNETVQSAMEVFMREHSLHYDVITGGKRIILTTWRWIDGRESVYDPDPNDGYNYSRYAYMRVRQDISFVLYERRGSCKRKFICSYLIRNDRCSNGYQKLGKKCCKLHNEEASWFNARNICLKDGSDLYIFDLGIPLSTIEWLRPGEYWIGLRKERWVWMIDRTSEELKYSNWADGDPLSRGGDCICLHVRAGTTKWTNCDCSDSYLYICIQGMNTTGTKLKTFKSTTTNPTDGVSSSHVADENFINKVSEDPLITVESGQTSDNERLIIWIPLAALIILIVVIAVASSLVIPKLRKRNGPAGQGMGSTTNTFQPASSADAYAALKREYLSTNVRTYAELDAYETIIIGDETRKTSA